MEPGATHEPRSLESENVTLPLASHQPCTQDQFDLQYGYHTKPEKTLRDIATNYFTRYKPSKNCARTKLMSCFPFVNIFKKYRLKDYLLADIVAGVTVGIMHIPQGLAYGLLASMSPMHGLYVSFFAPLVYFFLGSSKHISLGTMSIVAMMTGAVVDESGCEEKYSIHESAVNLSVITSTSSFNTSTLPQLSEASDMMSDVMICKTMYATSLAFMVGIMQILFGLLNLGIVTTYLSDPVTRAFTTGAAVHVFTSQIQLMFGIKTKRYSGFLKLVYVYRDFFGMISQTNWASVVMTIICAAFLIVFKEIINPKVKAKIKIPIPAELLLVIFGTLVSYLGDFNNRFSMRVVGLLPTGLPPPKVPETALIPDLLLDAFLIAVVAFVINVSLGKLFAQRNTYDIDPNQEFVAYGVTNLVSSLFLCFPSAAALSRSMIQENLGGRTQIASLVSCCLLLIVLFGVGTLFQALPNNVLAVIIAVNLKGIFWQVKDIPRLWRVCKTDLVVWLSVFLGVVFLDVDMGLLFGVAVCLLSVVYKTQSPQGIVMGEAGNTGVYRSTAQYDKVEENDRVKVFQFASSLYYASCEHFQKSVYKRSGINPIHLKIAKQKYAKKKAQFDKKSNHKDQNHADEEAGTLSPSSVLSEPTSDIKYIVIDCSMMAYIDSMGLSTLRQLIREYDDVGITILLSGCQDSLRESFIAADFSSKFPQEHLFVTIKDAVTYVTQKTSLHSNHVVAAGIEDVTDI